MAGIFKAYDIRGIYGETLTDDLAFKIGRAIQSVLGCKRVVIGRDMRPRGERRRQRHDWLLHSVSYSLL